MSRRFGFELEYSTRNINIDAIQRALEQSVAEHNPTKRVVQNETLRAWSVKHEHCGMEITSPAFESSAESMEIVKNVVDGLRQRTRGNELVRRDCGFHVHIDVADFTLDQIKNLCRIFYNFEGAIFNLQPNSRRDNHFVRHFARNDVSWIENFDPDVYNNRNANCDFVFDHSNAINFGRFLDRGTIEVRYAASTNRGVKVMGWIRMLLTLVEIAKSVNGVEINRTESVDDLKDFVGSHETSCGWINDQRNRCCCWITNRAKELTERQTRRRHNRR